MSTVKIRPIVTNVSTWEELRRFTAMALQSLIQTINGGLEFGFNIHSSRVVAALTTTEVRVPHRLDKVPTGFIVINLDAGEVVFSGVTPWTATEIYLQATGAVNATIEVI